MAWHADLLLHLLRKPICGYRDEPSPATEPTALTALALHTLGKKEVALNIASTLTQWQGPNGSVGVRPTEPQPAWPTSLAMLTWLQMDAAEQFGPHLLGAFQATLQLEGKKIPKGPATELGHDSELVGWSWAKDTHSWIEPTIFHILSLQAYGQSRHARVTEGLQLLIDRQLPGGGCNYGNTSVLGQLLRPHLQPSGMLLLALVGEEDSSGRLAKSIEYVAQGVNDEVTTASLCWGVLGLSAAGRRPAEADAWLHRAYKRNVDGEQSPLKFALIAHAVLGEDSPLIILPRKGKKLS